MDCKINNWWESLTAKEKDVLIELLYKLNLDEYVKKNKKGEYSKLY